MAKHKTYRVVIDGVRRRKTKRQWARYMGVSEQYVSNRLERDMTMTQIYREMVERRGEPKAVKDERRNALIRQFCF